MFVGKKYIFLNNCANNCVLSNFNLFDLCVFRNCVQREYKRLEVRSLSLKFYPIFLLHKDKER